VWGWAGLEECGKNVIPHIAGARSAVLDAKQGRDEKGRESHRKDNSILRYVFAVACSIVFAHGRSFSDVDTDASTPDPCVEEGQHMQKVKGPLSLGQL
jgi:hypothetical protein